MWFRLSNLYQLGQRIPLRIFVVDGMSMFPRLNHGDLILARKTADVQLNDIAVFRDPLTGIVAHRVVKKTAGILCTKGDNNPAPDPWLLSDDRVIGKLWLRIPFLGLPRLAMRYFQ